MKIYGLFFFYEKSITRISYLGHIQVTSSSKMECHPILRSVQQIQQHDSVPTQNQHFIFLR